MSSSAGGAGAGGAVSGDGVLAVGVVVLVGCGGSGDDVIAVCTVVGCAGGGHKNMVYRLFFLTTCISCHKSMVYRLLFFNNLHIGLVSPIRQASSGFTSSPGYRSCVFKSCPNRLCSCSSTPKSIRGRKFWMP